MIGDVQQATYVDPLDQKLIDTFRGRVVRKDLVYKLKIGFSIPV
jgi:ATP-dependent Lon protease